MATVTYSRDEIPPPTEAEVAHYRALALRPDSEIDCSDIPEVTEEEFADFLPWEEALRRRRERLAAAPDDGIDFSDIPRVTDFSGFMSREEARAFRQRPAAQKP